MRKISTGLFAKYSYTFLCSFDFDQFFTIYKTPEKFFNVLLPINNIE